MTMTKMKNQVVTEKYAIYNDDCVKVTKTFRDESVHFSIFSPPFSSMYSYSDDPLDMANNGSYEDFLIHFQFLADELHRVLVPGRVVAIHCMEIPTHKSSGEEIGLKDFPGDIIRLFQKSGFIFHSRHTVWKDPLIAATRTKALGLAHKQIVKDSAMNRTGIADSILAFRKLGVNPKPIKHPRGLIEYYGSRQVPKELDRFLELSDTDPDNPYDPKTDKRSHWIWQQFASPVWFDIRPGKTLQIRGSKDPEDQRHICPLQTDIIYRCLELWSTKGDVVYTPFLGVGSEVYCACKKGRIGVGAELKDRYFRGAIKNIKSLYKGEETE